MLKLKKIKPMFDAIVTTMDKYTEEQYLDSGLVDVTKQKGGLKEYQKVIAVGDTVRGINVGDFVCINPIRYAVKKHQEGSLKDGIIGDNPTIGYNFDVIILNEKEYLMLTSRDISFVIEEWEEVEDKAPSKIVPGTGDVKIIK